MRKILVIEKEVTKIESLKYIDSSLFFPVNKFVRICGGFIVGMFAFGEYLNQQEYIFLIFGVLAVFFLGYKKNAFKNNNYKKGIKFMIISSLLLVGTSSINKYVGENYDPALYIFLGNIIGIFYLWAKLRISKDKFLFRKEELLYGGLTGILGFGGLLFLLLSLKDGKLVIIQLITTMMILIPIVLSFIVYGERINKLRLLGLVLFVVNFGVFYLNK